MTSKKPLSKRGRAWPRHTPGRKEGMNIALKNRVQVVASEVATGHISIPLKRKYLTSRAYMQAPVGSPAQAARHKKRPYFPMSRNRAIPSVLVGYLR